MGRSLKSGETHAVQRWHEHTGIVSFYSFCNIQEPFAAPRALKSEESGLRRATGFDPLLRLFLSFSLILLPQGVPVGHLREQRTRSLALHSAPKEESGLQGYLAHEKTPTPLGPP